MAKGTGIYKYVKGEKIELSTREAKSYIQKQRGWTTEQYNKEYDKLRNRVRNFEKFEKSRGAKVQTENVSKLLYLETKAMKAYGSNYKPSIKLKRIREFTSVSTGKGIEKVLQSERSVERLAQQYETRTLQQFAGLIANNAKAQEIVNNIKDPVKLEQALTAYANSLHAKLDEEQKVIESSAIPFGDQTFGSESSFDFDYSEYL